MAGTAQRRAAYQRPLAELVLSPWILVPAALLLGSFLAYQFFHLTPRYIKAVFAFFFVFAAARLPLHVSLALFVILWPAPTFVYFGDTNVIFVALLALVWLVRVGLRLHPPLVRTPLDWAIFAYLGAHVLAFLNVTDPEFFRAAASRMVWLVAALVFYALIVNIVRTENHLMSVLKGLSVATAFVEITAVAEYYFGIRLVPEWFLYAGAFGSAAAFHAGGRAGGIFGFHGLLADFSAMNFYLMFVLGMRARGRGAKAWYYALALLSPVMIMNSANRGGAIIWAIGGIMFVWLYRRRIHWAKTIVGVSLLAAVVLGFGLASSRVLDQVTLFSRLAQTQFVRGIPENRVAVWANFLNLVQEHIWIGHGFYIPIFRGAGGEITWPHSAYLFYLYTAGILGLLAFLWISGKLLWILRPGGAVDWRRAPFGVAMQGVFFIQIAIFLLAQIRDEHQRATVGFYYVWLLYGLAVVSWRLARTEERAARAAPAEPAHGGGETG